MKYLFVLGRNPLLSEAEILSYLEKEGINAKNSEIRGNALLVEVDKALSLKEVINELGGTIAIGKVILSGDAESVLKDIGEKPIYLGRDNKVIYSVMDFAGEDEFSLVLDAMRKNFREERLKARYKGVSGTIKMQSGEVAHGSPEKIMLRDMNYFVFAGKDGNLSFGFLEVNYDSAESEKKDMEKPYRRESLAISPRLARILINLSQVKRKQTLLDPFCGIGVIMAEALLKGINALGVDIDRGATNNARQNLEWLKKNYKIEADYKLRNDDSRKIKVEGIDGIATEPSLGELLKTMPQRGKAEEMRARFENLMIDFLNNAMPGMKRGSKIAFTLPVIKSQKGRVRCNVEHICESTGFRIHRIKGADIEFPIEEFRRDQLVGREIAVLTL